MPRYPALAIPETRFGQHSFDKCPLLFESHDSSTFTNHIAYRGQQSIDFSYEPSRRLRVVNATSIVLGSIASSTSVSTIYTADTDIVAETLWLWPDFSQYFGDEERPPRACRTIFQSYDDEERSRQQNNSLESLQKKHHDVSKIVSIQDFRMMGLMQDRSCGENRHASSGLRYTSCQAVMEHSSSGEASRASRCKEHQFPDPSLKKMSRRVAWLNIGSRICRRSRHCLPMLFSHKSTPEFSALHSNPSSVTGEPRLLKHSTRFRRPWREICFIQF